MRLSNRSQSHISPNSTMVTGIEKLQDDVVDKAIPVTTLLQRSMVLANRLGDRGFIDWARQELKGCEEEDEQATHRNLKGEYVVLTTDGRLLPICWEGLPSWSNNRFIQLPISEIESLSGPGSGVCVVKISIDPQTLNSLDADPGDTIAFKIEKATLVGFLDAVRNRILEWTFEVASSEISQIEKVNPEKDVEMAIDSSKVFVVHGRNETARQALFAFLRTIGIHPLEWSEIIAETGKASPYIGEVLEKGFSMVQAVVVLMTPDDEAQLREPFRTPSDLEYESQLTPQARPNVLIEAGMALGLHPNRTIIVELGQLRPASDLLGRHVVRLSDTSQSRQDLADRLKNAGCSLTLSGRDWHSAGEFDTCIPSSLDIQRSKAGTTEVKMELIDKRYWVRTADGKKDGPFCIRCWDVDNKRVRIHQWSEDYLPQCPECKTPYPE